MVLNGFAPHKTQIQCLITIILPSLIACCDWLANVTTSVTMRSPDTAKGFHRTVTMRLSVSSLRRFLDCDVVLRFEVPAGAYLDIDGLRDAPLPYSWHTSGQFDVEQPAKESNGKSIAFYLCSRRPFVNSFVFEETFTLPVHLRYHNATSPANDASLTASLTLHSPEVMVRCKQGAPDLRGVHSNCARHLSKAPCACADDPLKLMNRKGHVPHSQFRPSLPVDASKVKWCADYIRLVGLGQGGTPLVFSVPVGNTDYALIVVGCTVVAVWTAVMLIGYSLWLGAGDAGKEKHKKTE